MSEVTEEDSARMEMEVSIYSQVVFIDVPPSYPLRTPVTCTYQLTGGMTSSTKDWIGIFKVGWESLQKYHCYEWVASSVSHTGPEPHRLQIVFKESYLPQIDEDDYQFCYIDSSGQVKGASTPFCFQNPAESSLDCSLDTDILVVATQEQEEQREKEKQALLTEMQVLKEEKMVMKKELNDRLLEILCLREQEEQREKEKHALLTEMEVLKEEKMIVKNELDDRLLEIRRLRTHIDDFKSKSLSELLSLKEQIPEGSEQVTQVQRLYSHTDESETQSESESLNHHSKKYEKAVQKILMLKEEGACLKEESERQQTENSELKSRLKKSEQDFNRLQDQLQLLQVDMQSSRKENERLRAELEQQVGINRDLEKENKDLMASMSIQGRPEGDKTNTKMQIEALENQLIEARAALRKEIQNCSDANKRAENSELELREMKRQLEERTVTENWKEERIQIMTVLEETRKKYAEQTNTATSAKLENQNLSKEKEGLKTQVEQLLKLLSELQPASPASNNLQQPELFSSLSTANRSQQQPQSDYESMHGISSSATDRNKARVCCHCQESFPDITEDELAVHEQSHMVCPFCTLICDGLSQQAFEDHVYSHED
ncbi:calcium-binding and coiled-coil domain-containing protein 2 [Trichomycterus rosablanca]|uniref:calcium-binding and coiled-coil domain-containing protein 2 n=1 Tax=Trichomycterus rosablanca TaxID=2290929 RepID=UPI002F3555A2